LANQAGSIKNLTYLNDDIQNHLDKIEKQAKDSDVDVVWVYLPKKTKKERVDPTYFLRYTEDEEGRLE